MKRILSLVLAFTTRFLGLISLAANSARAQEIASVGKSITEIKDGRRASLTF